MNMRDISKSTGSHLIRDMNMRGMAHSHGHGNGMRDISKSTGSREFSLLSSSQQSSSSAANPSALPLPPTVPAVPPSPSNRFNVDKIIATVHQLQFPEQLNKHRQQQLQQQLQQQWKSNKDMASRQQSSLSTANTGILPDDGMIQNNDNDIFSTPTAATNINANTNAAILSDDLNNSTNNNNNNNNNCQNDGMLITNNNNDDLDVSGKGTGTGLNSPPAPVVERLLTSIDQLKEVCTSTSNYLFTFS